MIDLISASEIITHRIEQEDKMCLYPKIIANRKYVINKKNKGIIPECKDERVRWVSAGCGKCMECRKQKMREWHVRLTEEIRGNKMKCHFVTLTYSDEGLNELDKIIVEENKKIKEKLRKSKKLKGHERNKKGYLTGYNRDNDIARVSVRRFTERWRKKYGKSVRHWLCTELGTKSTERLHMHGIIWTNDKEAIEERWQYGGVHIGEYVNDETIGYIVKYLNKSDKIHKEYKPKMFVSQGIGKGYLKRNDVKRNKYKKGETNELYKTREGIKLALPIYYRNKIYSEDEREDLWIEKLDKKERYVLGAKVDISENDKIYFKTLKEARKTNKRLGYGNNEKNWELKEYEQQRRNLIREERMKKKYG